MSLRVLLFLLFCVDAVYSVNITTYESSAVCSPYCDVYGHYQNGKWCSSTDPSVDVYCCGTAHDRYCCSDASKDVGDMYPAVTSCPNSSWWYYQWRVIIGLLCTLVVMLMFAACCYYCCDGNSRARAAALRLRGRRQEGIESGGHNSESNFDPSSPYAFTPPEYDSLPKDPPKYGDIFDGNGSVNPTFEANEGSSVIQDNNNISNDCINNNNHNAPTEGEQNEQHATIPQCPPPEYSSTEDAGDNNNNHNAPTSGEQNEQHANIQQCPPPAYSSREDAGDNNNVAYNDIIEEHIIDTQHDNNSIPLNTLKSETTVDIDNMTVLNTSEMSESSTASGQEGAESTGQNTVLSNNAENNSNSGSYGQGTTVVQIEDNQLVPTEPIASNNNGTDQSIN